MAFPNEVKESVKRLLTYYHVLCMFKNIQTYFFDLLFTTVFINSYNIHGNGKFLHTTIYWFENDGTLLWNIASHWAKPLRPNQNINWLLKITIQKTKRTTTTKKQSKLLICIYEWLRAYIVCVQLKYVYRTEICSQSSFHVSYFCCCCCCFYIVSTHSLLSFTLWVCSIDIHTVSKGGNWHLLDKFKHEILSALQ